MSESKKPTNLDILEAAFNISTETAAFEHSIAMGVKEQPNIAESAKQEPKLKGNIIESTPNLSTLEKFAKSIQEIRTAGLYKMIQGRINNNFTHVWDGNSPTEASKSHILSNSEADRTISKLPLVRKKLEKLLPELNLQVNKVSTDIYRLDEKMEAIKKYNKLVVQANEYGPRFADGPIKYLRNLYYRALEDTVNSPGFESIVVNKNEGDKAFRNIANTNPFDLSQQGKKKVTKLAYKHLRTGELPEDKMSIDA